MIQKPLPGFQTTTSDPVHFWSEGTFFLEGLPDVQLGSVVHPVPCREMDKKCLFILSLASKWDTWKVMLFSGMLLSILWSANLRNPFTPGGTILPTEEKVPKLGLMSQHIVTCLPNGKEDPCLDCPSPWHIVTEHLSHHLNVSSLHLILRCLPVLRTSIFEAPRRQAIIDRCSCTSNPFCGCCDVP